MRPFTLLDLRDSAHLSIALAHQSPESVHVIASDTVDVGIFEQPRIANVLAINKTQLYKKLHLLWEMEHVDVVILGQELYRVVEWETILSHLSQCADHLLINVSKKAGNNKEQRIHNKIESLRAQLIEEDEEKELRLVSNTQHYIRRKHSIDRKQGIETKRMIDHQYSIVSDFQQKCLIKEKANISVAVPWVSGIHIVTFMWCDGTYPNKETIKKALMEKKDVEHDDWGMLNIVIQGENIALIDDKDPFHRSRRQICPPVLLNGMCLLLDNYLA